MLCILFRVGKIDNSDNYRIAQECEQVENLCVGLHLGPWVKTCNDTGLQKILLVFPKENLQEILPTKRIMQHLLVPCCVYFRDRVSIYFEEDFLRGIFFFFLPVLAS